jgi:hypothetical protein
MTSLRMRCWSAVGPPWTMRHSERYSVTATSMLSRPWIRVQSTRRPRHYCTPRAAEPTRIRLASGGRASSNSGARSGRWRARSTGYASPRIRRKKPCRTASMTNARGATCCVLSATCASQERVASLADQVPPVYAQPGPASRPPITLTEPAGPGVTSLVGEGSLNVVDRACGCKEASILGPVGTTGPSKATTILSRLKPVTLRSHPNEATKVAGNHGRQRCSGRYRPSTSP